MSAPGGPPTPRARAVLLSFQLTGEVLTRARRLPIPGPVMGVLLLLRALRLRRREEDGLRTGLDALATTLLLPAILRLLGP